MAESCFFPMQRLLHNSVYWEDFFFWKDCLAGYDADGFGMCYSDRLFKEVWTLDMKLYGLRWVCFSAFEGQL
jgi:hypothetical protein